MAANTRRMRPGFSSTRTRRRFHCLAFAVVAVVVLVMFLLLATSASNSSAAYIEQVGGDVVLLDQDVQEFDRFLRRDETAGEAVIQDGRTYNERAAASLDRQSAEEDRGEVETTSRHVQGQRRLGGRGRLGGVKGLGLQGTDGTFRPGLRWLDRRGRNIEAHGGSVIYVKEERKWYWYGEDKEGDTYLLPGSLARVSLSVRE